MYRLLCYLSEISHINGWGRRGIWVSANRWEDLCKVWYVFEGLSDQGGKEELIFLFFHTSFRSFPFHTSCGWHDFLEVLLGRTGVIFSDSKKVDQKTCVNKGTLVTKCTVPILSDTLKTVWIRFGSRQIYYLEKIDYFSICPIKRAQWIGIKLWISKRICGWVKHLRKGYPYWDESID